MNDFETLNGSVNVGAGQVTLTWSLHGLPYANSNVVNQVQVLRTPFGANNYTVIATNSPGDFAGSTYTDTVPAVGQYSYVLKVTIGQGVGIPGGGRVLESNVISASTLSNTTLSASVGPLSPGDSARQVNLTWTTGTSPENQVDDTLVQRSLDGVNWHTVHNVSGPLASSFSETVPAGTYKYRVIVSLEFPELPGPASETNDVQITSNIVTVTVN